MQRFVVGAHAARSIVVALMFTLGINTFAFAQDSLTSREARDSANTDGIGREELWPRVVKAGGTTLTVFAPQVDAWDGFTLAARFAVRANRDGDVMYGVVALELRTLTDRSARVVSVERGHVKDVHFVGASSETAHRWANAIIRDLKSSRTIAFDRLVTSLAATELELTGGHRLDNTPPRILVATSPSVLVTIDGPAKYRALSDSRFYRVVNTRALLLRDDAGRHYLRLLNGWMISSGLDGGWSALRHPSLDLETALDEALAIARKARIADELPAQTIPGETVLLDKRPPTVHVVHEPTEMVVVDGAPNWTPVPDRRVFYLLNTTGRVLKSGQDFKVYALIAGRWFRAETLRGPWSFVPANQLPSDFARIPDRSPIQNVEASIAGTSEAREAAIATTIAQSVAISASASHISTPRFDGEPSFRDIEGTKMHYAANTATPIIRLNDGTLYAVENGVWFTAASAEGPWSVARSLPNEIYLIPPTSPVYFTTFVHVFAAEGDTVFVGYTPGYEGAYIDPATQVVVYGTGHAYERWLEHDWFPSPSTYGLTANPTFTPWTGWRVAFGLGATWSSDVLAVAWPLEPYPWWSPWSWGWSYGVSKFPWHPTWGRAREAIASHPAGWLAYAGDIYKTWNDRGLLRRANDVAAWTENEWARRVGLSYNSHTLVASSGEHGALENLLDDLSIRPKTVAVTPSGQLVATRRTWGVLASDSIVHAEPGEAESALASLPEEYRNARIITSGPHLQTAAGTLAPNIGADELFAGPGPSVYRRAGGTWQRRTASGWEPVHDLSALDRARRMRELGDTRVQNLRDASYHLWQLTLR